MLTNRSLAEFAELEYRRDSKFRKFVDERVKQLQQDEVVDVGLGLRAVLEMNGPDGLPLAKAWLNDYHGRTSQPQWRRVRDLEKGLV